MVEVGKEDSGLYLLFGLALRKNKHIGGRLTRGEGETFLYP